MSSSTGSTEFERLRSDKNRLIQSGYNKGTIRSDNWCLVVSKDVRRHRLISISYISHGRCHGRGREFESRVPAIFSITYPLCPSESSQDRKSTRLNSSHLVISYAVFCLKKKKTSTPHVISPACRTDTPPCSTLALASPR